MSGFTVKYFMWPYQPHFQIGADSAAKRLFGRFQSELDAKLFLVGIRREGAEGQHPICIEPDHWPIGPEIFNDLGSRIRECVVQHPNSGMFYTGQNVSRIVHERVVVESTAKAIELCCDAACPSQERRFVASKPVPVAGYDVSCVVSLARVPYDRHVFDLPHTGVGAVGTLSLVEAIAREFLSSCAEGLREPNPGMNLGVVKADTEELLRRGGQALLKRIDHRLIKVEELQYQHTLYTSFERLSGMRYEGSAPMGEFVFVGTNDLSRVEGVKFTDAVRLRESRRVRKLMELTRKSGHLVVSPQGVAGVIQSRQRAGISIGVLGFRHWRLLFEGRMVCDFREGVPELPSLPHTKDDFFELCSRTFAFDFNAESLWDTVQACFGRENGTTLVISTAAESEIARLSRQSTPIFPRKLVATEIQAVTGIDGAIMLDKSGVCHGIGVILDGLATSTGDPARGARYNSAVRYLHSQQTACIILIVSEDGDVTLLPKLLPRIHKATVKAALAELTERAMEEPLRRRVYAEALSAVEDVRFYLSSKECEQANAAVSMAEAKIPASDKTVVFVRDSFAVNPAMNDSYFFPDNQQGPGIPFPQDIAISNEQPDV